MIDSGQIDYALVVNGESARYTQEVTMARLAGPQTSLFSAHLAKPLAFSRSCQ
jgi:hypothetical protein